MTTERDIYLEKPFYRWLALAAALLAWGFDGVEQGVYALMTRAALKDLIPGATEGDVGFYFSLSMAMWLWGAAVGGVWFGRMGDQYGRVRILIYAVLTYSVFTGLSAMSQHWVHLAVCRFLGALGLGGTWPLCVALVVETWPERNRAVLAGAIGCAANVGFLIAATYSRAMLAHGSSWRWVIGMGFVIGLMSLPVIWFVPEPTKWRQSRAKHQNQKVSLRELFSPQYRRSVIVGSLLSTVALLGTWGSFLWLATYIDKIAEGTAHAGTAKAIVSQWQSIGQLTGGFMGGVLAGWLGNKRSWLMLCAATWISVMALFGLTTEFDFRVGVLAMVAGFFVTAYFGWLPKYLPELFPTHIRAMGQGFAFNIGRVLTGLGVLGAGFLTQFFQGDYRKAAMTMASVYLIGLAVIFFAPDTGGRMKSDEVK